MAPLRHKNLVLHPDNDRRILYPLPLSSIHLALNGIPLTYHDPVETVGYIGRAMSANQSPNWTIGPYIIQSTLLLIAPALFAASIYMELGRVIVLVRGEKFSLIRASGKLLPGQLQPTPSCAGLMVTAANGGSADSASMGKNVIIGGLFVQIIFFGFFLLSAVVFQRRLVTAVGGGGEGVLILVRSVVRVVEYVQGTDGFVMSNEVFIYAFDGLLVWVVLVILVVVHPCEVGRLLKREKMRMGRGFGIDGAEPLV
ncbi:hypothetical protein N7533_003492 [Penicillium manginii]|uniref:uncharacterized protein n=1 Tax=Penicillium manginii TaxID=203109 RepID=UPI002546E2D8|nr:uncharacterized protein N7533_003492 [Penicillium manginii]KAJ5761453.1 hypothetical protein N7533_003492 [Penicillium manginii]